MKINTKKFCGKICCIAWDLILHQHVYIHNSYKICMNVIQLHFVKINRCANNNLLTALLQICLLHKNHVPRRVCPVAASCASSSQTPHRSRWVHKDSRGSRLARRETSSFNRRGKDVSSAAT